MTALRDDDAWDAIEDSSRVPRVLPDGWREIGATERSRRQSKAGSGYVAAICFAIIAAGAFIAWCSQ